MTKPTALERFWSKVEKTDTCWNWTGASIRGGYGMLLWRERRRLAHRISYEIAHGDPVPDGLTVDHLCRNPRCVNPDHLEVVTNRENVLRGAGPTAINARKTHCVNGHALEGDNLLQRSDGGRRCRECQREVDLNRRPFKLRKRV